MTKTIKQKTDTYRAANLEAARIITADPVKYPEGSLMAIWADLVLEASDEAVCVGLDRPAGFAASSIDGMRRSIRAVHRWQ